MSSLKKDILEEIKKLLNEEVGGPGAGGIAAGATGALVGAAATGAGVMSGIGVPIGITFGASMALMKAFLADNPSYLRILSQAKDTAGAAKAFSTIINDRTGVGASDEVGYSLAVLLQTIDPRPGRGDWDKKSRVIGKDIPPAGNNTGSAEKSFQFVYEYYKLTNPSAAKSIQTLGKIPEGLNYPSSEIAKLDFFWRAIVRMQAERIWKAAKTFSISTGPTPQPKPPDVKPGPETCPPGEFLLDGRCVKLTAQIICKGPQIINCVPKCKDHPNLQPPKCVPPCKPGQKTGCAEEKEIKKYPGCKPGSQAKGFVGFNGVTSGPEVESIQRALKYYHFKETGEADRSRGFKYKGMTDQSGTFGPATESALYDFQAQNGGKYAAKLKNELGSSLGNPDACAGPRTACALVLVAGTAGVRGGTIAGYDLAKCKARFGKKKIEKGTLAQAEPEEAAGGLAESKNWLDRTREKTASNLFERLVKDTAKKVI